MHVYLSFLFWLIEESEESREAVTPQHTDTHTHTVLLNDFAPPKPWNLEPPFSNGEAQRSQSTWLIAQS